MVFPPVEQVDILNICRMLLLTLNTSSFFKNDLSDILVKDQNSLDVLQVIFNLAPIMCQSVFWFICI